MDKNKNRENYLSLLLLESLEDENMITFEKLIKEFDADPNKIVLDRGLTPTHYACGMENLEMAEKALDLLLKHGADPNVRSSENMTPLHVAAISGRTKIVRMLLEKGADIHLADNHKYTPIQYAFHECHFNIFETIKNFVFEQKLEEKKQIKMKKNLLDVKNLEEKKFTPNRINYNFDITSPYYINITHRRKKPTSFSNSITLREDREVENNEDNSTKNNEAPSFLTSTWNEGHEELKDLFELTEQNLTELSKNVTTECSRISLIQNWRDKVQSSKNRKSVLQKCNDIDDLLNIIMTNEKLDFTNTVLKSEEELQLEKSPLKKSFNNTSFGKLINKLNQSRSKKSDNSFITAVEIPLSESNFIRSPNHNECVIQMAEQYEHIDHDHGLIFFEEKLLMNPPTIKDKKSLNQSHSSLSTDFTVPLDYDTEALRVELTQFGEAPGPITKSTKRLYTKRLMKYKRNPHKIDSMTALKNDGFQNPSFSVELERTVRNIEWYHRIKEYLDLENQMCHQFKNNNSDNKVTTKKWREGNIKQSFIYFLIDPRISNNLPCKSVFIDKHDVWKRFLSSIFYVGKGKSSRPYAHLYDAFKIHSRNVNPLTNPQSNGPQHKKIIKFVGSKLFESPRKQTNESRKLERILDIWKSETGVVCLHVFHNLLPAEAYTREASIIDAIGLQHLTNLKRGDYYGPAQSWTMRTRKCLGIALLLKALKIFLVEGESQLFPCDLF